MLVFLDTEFTNFFRPELISIGLVTEDGREFYAELSDINEANCSDFVVETVLPLLGRVPGAACTAAELTERLVNWSRALPEASTLIYDYDLDWDFFNAALNDIGSVPSRTWEKVYLNDLVLEHPVFYDAKFSTFTKDWPQHHALVDARAMMNGFRAFKELPGR
jgi:hypothetical protein